MNKYGWLDAYLLSKPGATKDFKVEWEWWRYMVDGRLFAAICHPSGEHATVENRELVSLKCEPLRAEAYREAFADVIPGFYMDKRNWNSVYLDGDVPEELLRQMCDESYALVLGKLSKKRQREIAQGEKKS